MAGEVERRLETLGIVLPTPPAAVGAYVGCVRAGSLALVSGQLPWRDGVLEYVGKVGQDLTIDQGYQAARLCAIHALAQLKAVIGDLDAVTRVLRVEGYVQSGPEFQQQPKVMNGASELFAAAFGEAGVHTRVALGVAEMPLDAAVQVSAWFEVR